MSKPKRTWMRGAVVCHNRATDDWRLILADGREFLLPKMFTFSAEQKAAFRRMLFGAKIDA